MKKSLFLFISIIFTNFVMAQTLQLANINPDNQKLKIYAISGLGADERAFEYLKLNCEFIPLPWIEPKKKESIQEYALRLSAGIDTTAEYGILGVSFGGLIAIEMNKFLNSSITILISSIETKKEVTPLFKFLGKTGIMRILPPKAFDPPRNIAAFIFGAQNKKLLYDILDDTDLVFAKWAANALTTWKNKERIPNILRIHGTNDRMLPLPYADYVHKIKNGGHFMIVDKADEISKIINDEFIKLKLCNRHVAL